MQPALALLELGADRLENGQAIEAEECFRKALEIEPCYAEAHFKLGNALLRQERIPEAETCYLTAIGLTPTHVKSLYNLANTLVRQSRFDEAENFYRQALVVDPDYTNAHNNLGVLLADRGRYAEAEACYRQVLRLVPDDAVAMNNLGVSLTEQERFAEAEEVLVRALEQNPSYPEANNSLGIVLKQLGRLEEAEMYYQRALVSRPHYPEALNNLGITLKAQSRLEEAETAYRKVLSIGTTLPEAYTNLAIMLREQGRLSEAEEACTHLLSINPENSKAYNDLGCILTEQGRSDKAIHAFRRALEITPDYIDARTNLLFALNYFGSDSAVSQLNEAREYGRVVSAKTGAGFASWSCSPAPTRLRVGLVSGDLRTHVVSYFLEGLLDNIDTSRIELFAYPTTSSQDETSDRIKARCAAWSPIVDMSDQTAANLIHSDGIHILIDLSGHTTGNRLPVFAWKPAPVQVSWLGYFATTGVAEIDYLLADRTGVPEASRSYFTESIWYLPDTRLCFSEPGINAPVSSLPAKSSGSICFACFQNLSKINDNVLTTWGRILAALPHARLRFQHSQLETHSEREALLNSLQQVGIASDRVSIHGGLDRGAYFAAHAEVDLILDTFPYPGGTTTCEALWMGVPTLTLAGATMIQRQGASLMSAAGLTDWVAESEADYIRKAIAFASNIDLLAELRSRLRQQVLDSPLLDSARFARNFEDALWTMWQKYAENVRGI